ncbi:hypothetical protein VTI74DRAFT_4364 [Chaetomium olivicolor]
MGRSGARVQTKGKGKKVAARRQRQNRSNQFKNGRSPAERRSGVGVVGERKRRSPGSGEGAKDPEWRKPSQHGPDFNFPVRQGVWAVSRQESGHPWHHLLGDRPQHARLTARRLHLTCSTSLESAAVQAIHQRVYASWHEGSVYILFVLPERDWPPCLAWQERIIPLQSLVSSQAPGTQPKRPTAFRQSCVGQLNHGLGFC